MRKEGLSNAKLARQGKILDAAQHLSLLHGFRATTMEAIAQEAGVAKATAYAYFNDKEATFVGVAERLAGQLENAVAQELAREGSAADRISAALVAKHRIIHDLVRKSAHAAEIFAVSNRLTGSLFAQTDARIRTRLSTALAGSQAGPKADETIRLLFASAQGIANSSTDFDVVSSDIRRLISALIPASRS